LIADHDATVEISRGIESMLSEDQWQAFRRDGYMTLGKVLEPEQVAALQQRADDIALGRVVNPLLQMQLDTGGEYKDLPAAVNRFEQGTALYRKIQGLENDELFAALIQTPVFREVCAEIYGRHSAVSIFRAMIMNKPSGQGTHLPWHQDGGYVWQLDRDPRVTIWVALDPATRENGCMEAVRGSHRLGLLSLYGSTVEDEMVRKHCDPEKIVTLEVPSGHAILIHNWLIHRSGINPSSIPRRAFTMCCMDARTRGILTGDYFPTVYGEFAPEPYPFIRHLQNEHAFYRETAAEAQRYAESLRDELTHLRASRDAAAEYAKSLENEVAQLRQSRLDAETYAQSLEAHIRTAAKSDLVS
jgi:hypothetical protein